MRGHRSIGQGTPFPACTVIESRGVQRQKFTTLPGRNEAAAGGQHPTEIFGQSFVYPQQIALHRLLIIRCRQTLRPAVLTVPRMDKFVRKQGGTDHLGRRIGEEGQARLDIAGLVMLQAEMSNLIAERKQEVILPVMRRAEQRLSLLDEPPVFRN